MLILHNVVELDRIDENSFDDQLKPAANSGGRELAVTQQSPQRTRPEPEGVSTPAPDPAATQALTGSGPALQIIQSGSPRSHSVEPALSLNPATIVALGVEVGREVGAVVVVTAASDEQRSDVRQVELNREIREL